jgi:2-polyprenyl-3-methyl-5-hydroxy-6-metoxy-1,4-benzoquinol methylase
MNNQNLYSDYTSSSVFSNKDEERILTSNYQCHFKFHISPHLPTDRYARILDLGCGYGRNIMALRDCGYLNIVGIDISEEQVVYAKSKMGLTEIFQKDALTWLENKTKCYECIMILDVLEHLTLDESLAVLKKCYTALSEDGIFIIQVPNALSPLSPLWHGDITHLRAFSPDSMSQLLRMTHWSCFKHYSLGPIPRNFKSTIRWLLWNGVLSPMIKLFMIVANSETRGGIYTSNLLTVVTKK